MNNRAHSENLVIHYLGGASILLIVGIVGLLGFGIKPDGSIYTILAGCIGALGALLSQTGNRGQQASVSLPEQPGALPEGTSPATIAMTGTISQPDIDNSGNIAIPFSSQKNADSAENAG